MNTHVDNNSSLRIIAIIPFFSHLGFDNKKNMIDVFRNFYNSIPNNELLVKNEYDLRKIKNFDALSSWLDCIDYIQFSNKSSHCLETLSTIMPSIDSCDEKVCYISNGLGYVELEIHININATIYKWEIPPETLRKIYFKLCELIDCRKFHSLEQVKTFLSYSSEKESDKFKNYCKDELDLTCGFHWSYSINLLSDRSIFDFPDDYNNLIKITAPLINGIINHKYSEVGRFCILYGNTGVAIFTNSTDSKDQELKSKLLIGLLQSRSSLIQHISSCISRSSKLNQIKTERLDKLKHFAQIVIFESLPVSNVTDEFDEYVYRDLFVNWEIEKQIQALEKNIEIIGSVISNAEARNRYVAEQRIQIMVGIITMLSIFSTVRELGDLLYKQITGVVNENFGTVFSMSISVSMILIAIWLYKKL